jgi:hypothetical protein
LRLHIIDVGIDKARIMILYARIGFSRLGGYFYVAKYFESIVGCILGGDSPASTLMLNWMKNAHKAISAHQLLAPVARPLACTSSILDPNLDTPLLHALVVINTHQYTAPPPLTTYIILKKAAPLSWPPTCIDILF